MKAVILAGGKGTRLAPYTTIFPKSLMPLGDRPILEIVIRQLAFYGFNDVVLSVGHLASLIQAYFQGVTVPNLNITYVTEDKPMGTAGSLSLVPDLNDTFLVMNGDILTSLDYSKLVAYHKEQGGILTIGMNTKCHKVDLGVIETDSNGIITNYIEKPETEYKMSMGIYVYEPAALKYIEPNEHLDFPDLVLRLLENGEKVVGYPCDDYWLDLGTHDDYEEAQNEFEEMKGRLLPDV